MTGMDVTTPQRSTFVSVVAWIFIALSSLGVVIGIIQNLIFGLIFEQTEFKELLANPEQNELPGYMVFIFENIQLIMALSLLLVILLLVSSIGLLLRKNWARRIFITYMFIMCLYMVIGSLAQAFWVDEIMQAQGINTSSPKAGAFADMFLAIQYTVLIFNAGIGVVFGWLGWKLMRPEIKIEFNPSVNAVEV